MITNNINYALSNSGLTIYKKISLGVSSDVYLLKSNSGKNIITKIRNYKQIKRVVLIQSFLEQSRVKTPKIIFKIRLSEREILLGFEFVQGRHLLFPSDHEITQLIMEITKMHKCKNISKLHTSDIVFHDIYILLKKCTGMSVQGKLLNIIKRNHSIISIMRDLPKVIIHGDISPSNAIYLKSRLHAIIDFDHSGVAPRVIDIARMMIFYSYDYNDFNKNKFRFIVNTFNTQIQLSTMERKSIFPLFILLLVKMILETYYYTVVLEKVSSEKFKNDFNHSWERLIKKLDSALKECDNVIT